MRNSKILVTGGAGFIGSNIVRQLINDNNEVTVLDNLLSGHISNLDPFPEVNFIQGDIRNVEIVREAMKNVEFVFHLAASVGNKRSIDNPIEDASINVIGTINVLESAKKLGVKKIITSSSAGIFGELKTIPIKEDHPVEPDSPYGCTKLCEEKLCLTYAKLYPIEVVCLRYFNVYGPNQRFDAYGNVIPIFVHNMLHNIPIRIFGDGEQTRDFVHVNDVVQANIKAADAYNISGAYNIASGERITINKLVEIITKKHKSSQIVYDKERLGDVRHSLADLSNSKRDFNYSPSVSLESGIADYIEWAKGNIK